MARTQEKAPAVKTRKEEVSREEVEKAAYYHWLERGCPEGDALTDWVEVERNMDWEKHQAAARHN